MGSPFANSLPSKDIDISIWFDLFSIFTASAEGNFILSWLNLDYEVDTARKIMITKSTSINGTRFISGSSSFFLVLNLLIGIYI